MSSLAVFHLGVGCFVLLVEVIRYLARRQLDYLSLVMVMYAVFYGFAPALLHWANAIGYEHSWSAHVDYETEVLGLGAYDVAAIATLVGYLAIRVGWLAGKGLTRQTARRAVATADEVPVDLVPLAWVLLLAAVAIYYPYTKAYGGYLRVLSVATAIRGGWVQISNPWSFLKSFGGLSMYASYLFLASLLNRRRGGIRHAIRLWAGFVLSLVFSSYVYIVWGARLSMVFFVLAVMLAVVLAQHKRVYSGRLLVALGLTVIALLTADALIQGARSALLQLAGDAPRPRASISMPRTPVDFALAELSFPIVSVATSAGAVSQGIVAPRLLIDFPLSVAYLVPKRWLRGLPAKASTINTELIVSDPSGEIPVDLISMAVYSLGLPGLPVYAFGYGLALFLVQRAALRLHPVILRPVLYVVLGLLAARTLAYADPVEVMAGSFYIILGLATTHLYWRMQAWRRPRRA